MKSLKTKTIIGNGLYLIAIVLLLINIYMKGANHENKLIDMGSWLMLLIAAIYGIWLSMEKKKTSSDQS